MGVICIRTYEARCDGDGCPEQNTLGVGNWLDRQDVFVEALAVGWLKKGRKLYCPDCRAKHEGRAKKTIKAIPDIFEDI